MNAKRFFYVSASLFLLAASATLGTQYVHAQAQGNAQIVDVDATEGWIAVDTLRRVRAFRSAEPFSPYTVTTCPGPGTPVAIRRPSTDSGRVFMDNGDIWWYQQTAPNGPFTWTLVDNFFSGSGTPTDARQPPASKSWSAVKDAYRK